MKTVKFYAFGANGNSDPRHREGSNTTCSNCSNKFSFWDDINLSPNDKKLKCANCKGIIIDLIINK